MKRLEDMTEPELAHVMSVCARAVDMVLEKYVSPPEDGSRRKFVLVVFDDPQIAQYVSSCQRPDMITAMRETADRLERQEDIPR